MFDQNNRVKITVGVLLAAYSLGASQGAIKSKITEHLDKESAVKADVDSLKAHFVTATEDIEDLEGDVGMLKSSVISTKKQINHFHPPKISATDERRF